MSKKIFKITSLSPILITGRNGNPNNVSTLDFIPGGVLLGYYASKYIRENNLGEDAHLNENFYNVFLSNKVIFSNSYITDDNNYYYVPAPISIEKEKYGNNLYDFLILDEGEFPDISIKKLNGYIYLDEEKILKKEVKKIYNFHHERDRETGSTKKGMIFNYEAIAPEESFLGEILYDEDLKGVIEPLLKNEIIYIGRSKKNQYGKAKIEFINNKKLELIDEEPSEATLTFLSDTIILDENGVPSLDIKNLSKKLGVEIKKAYLKSTTVESYNSKWKFKTPSVDAFMAGSCFLLNELPENYKEFEVSGLGENRNQGFGRIVFGLQNREELYLQSTKVPTEKPKPKGDIPEVTKKIMRNLIKAKMLDNVKMRAIQDAEGFENNLISTSLAGKLQFFVEKSNSFDEFHTKIKGNRNNSNREGLKDISLKNLRRCNNGEQNLEEFLENEKKFSESVKNLFGKDKLKEFDFVIDEKLLFKTYYKEFFITLRKLSKLQREAANE